jgi:F-type H+-transporting ATPase subunit gamma
MADLLADVLWQVADADGDGVLSPEELRHPLLWGNPDGPRGLLLITADRGLCGGFNTSLIKKGLEFMRENKAGHPMELITAGRKARDYFRRVGAPIHHEYVGIFNQLTYSQAEVDRRRTS